VSGRKQHHIPRLVLRGFETGKTKKGVSQVWWFSRDKDPVRTAVDNVFAQRDFYGDPGSDLDDRITEIESRLGKFVNHARKLTTSEDVVPNTDAVDLCNMMSMRSRWIRQVFGLIGDEALGFVSEQLSDSAGVLELMKDQTSQDPNWLRESFVEEATRHVGRELSEGEIAEIESVADQVSNNWERVVPLLDISAVQDLLRVFGKQLPQITKDGHIQGITKSLSGNSLREFFEGLEWRIEVCPDSSLILGDCGPLLVNESGTILGPMGVPSKSEVFAAVFPISHSHLLIGGHVDVQYLDNIATETAAWSLDAFVSSTDSPACIEAQKAIGRNVDGWVQKDLNLRR
jgi:uncharacterized protein DUF4238